jgi:hypothetical protein
LRADVEESNRLANEAVVLAQGAQTGLAEMRVEFGGYSVTVTRDLHCLKYKGKLLQSTEYGFEEGKFDELSYAIEALKSPSSGVADLDVIRRGHESLEGRFGDQLNDCSVYGVLEMVQESVRSLVDRGNQWWMNSSA